MFSPLNLAPSTTVWPTPVNISLNPGPTWPWPIGVAPRSTRLVAWSTLVLSAAAAVPQERARAARNPGVIHSQRSVRVMTHLRQSAWFADPCYHQRGPASRCGPRPALECAAGPFAEGGLGSPPWTPPTSRSGDSSMRTVVGSRGCVAVDLLFRAERVRKAVAQLPQDRRSAERQYPDSRLSVCPTGPRARYPRRQASTNHPFAHEAHDVVFDLDDRWSSKRGGPISRRS